MRVMEQIHSGHEFDNPKTHHEESDVSVRAIAAFAVALVIVAVLVHLAVYLLYRFYASGTENVRPSYPITASQQEQMPALPRLQTNPRQDLLDLRSQEDRILSTYGWADRNAGAVRIPIADAMKLTLQRGLPSRDAAAPGTAPTTSGDASSGRYVGEIKK